ncbi:hypothetical protein GCM10010286_12620 [Streptomyces toxytricini]|nr:hypothetical protein GCM10010286_12620 [Streptomyces toxytricini]
MRQPDPDTGRRRARHAVARRGPAPWREAGPDAFPRSAVRPDRASPECATGPSRRAAGPHAAAAARLTERLSSANLHQVQGRLPNRVSVGRPTL